MSNGLLQAWIYYAPEGTLLGLAQVMLTVKEGDIEDLPGLVAAVVAQGTVLKVRVLDVAKLFELLDIHMGLVYSSPPTVISEVDSVAKSLDAPLEHLV